VCGAGLTVMLGWETLSLSRACEMGMSKKEDQTNQIQSHKRKAASWHSYLDGMVPVASGW
jgi:hypothetical protein